MTKYGKAAIEAIKLLASDSCHDPKDAWDKSTEEIFGRGTASQSKGCPRGAFLGLCEQGLIKGRGVCG